jgi:hypothetical protein
MPDAFASGIFERVLPPLKTRSRKKTCIFPKEFATLMACADVRLHDASSTRSAPARTCTCGRRAPGADVAAGVPATLLPSGSVSERRLDHFLSGAINVSWPAFRACDRDVGL